MALIQPACPECGTSAAGTVEIVPDTGERGVAYITGYHAHFRAFQYVGRSTMTFEGADGYESDTVTERGRVLLACRNGHEWLWEPPQAGAGTAR
jgi:hypothetical protein